jgi:MbtH protein
MFDREDIEFQVIVNGEEQYSLWPAAKEIPRGWQFAGKRGPKGECLVYVDQVWVDMRPLSLRNRMTG